MIKGLFIVRMAGGIKHVYTESFGLGLLPVISAALYILHWYTFIVTLIGWRCIRLAFLVFHPGIVDGPQQNEGNG